ncbi:MAG: putative tributyrin esterase [Petrotoga sp.]|nr:putative tributyrin esterase [Petrotoga sp.]
MALLQVNFMSKSLMRKVPILVVLPVDKVNLPGMSEITDNRNNSFKTLYLLHGMFGNYTDWVSETRIQRLAEERNLVVVMPSGENSFYLDQPESGNFYGEFIGKELVDITRKMFPLSKRREDTFIAGLSMGGYGAIRNGLKYHETFGYIAGLSSALILEQMLNESFKEIAYEKSCFGDPQEAILSDKNPKILVKHIREKMKEDPSIHFPKMYMACGTEDDLLGTNRDFRDFLMENNVDLTYEEGPGAHTWDFWDTYIEKVLDWLPLKN